jgi:GNAT superfamily N-acetyltransferase
LIYIKITDNPSNISDHQLRDKALHSSKATYTKHYIAYDYSDEIGFLSLDIIPNTDYLILYEIYVKPHLRRRGIGTELLKLVERHARELDYKYVFVRPQPMEENISKDHLITWYLNNGFIVKDKVPDELYKLI